MFYVRMKTTDIHWITDLRKKPGTILEQAATTPQFIFKNNKVVGVIISPEDFDTNYPQAPSLHEISYDAMNDYEKSMRDESQSLDISEYISYSEL